MQVVSAGAIVLWLLADYFGPGIGDGTVASVAIRLLWAIGAAVVINIITTIVVTIIVSIVRREELKDEAADERDRSIAALSARNGFVVTSIAAVAGLVGLALGADTVLGAYALFGAAMLGGVVDALSRLVYYRIG